MGRPSPEPDQGELPAADAVVYPQHRGGNWWTLSNGDRFQGTREAAEHAESQLAAVDEDADADDDDAVDET